MAARRLSMRKIREILRLKYEQECSVRQIAASCNVSIGIVSDYLLRARSAGLTWPLPPDYDDAVLEQQLFPSSQAIPGSNRQMPPMEYLHHELKKKRVTLQLLWYEYKQANPDGYQYSQFCELYRRWKKDLDVCLRQEHRAGEKLFVDYAGDTIPYIDPATGEIRQAEIFVAVLGASNYTFAEGSHSQELHCWITSHIHAFEYFGGVPEIVVPDNLKCGITNPCRYEPDVNPTYHDLAQHYGVTIIPARPAKPKDKAKVEAGVLIAERWIIAALRNRTFFGIAEVNQAIREKLAILNTRKFKKLDTTRAEFFKTMEKPLLRPLPAHPYEIAQWKKATVHIDYHVEVDRHHYSVPYRLTGRQCDIRFTASTVEILIKNRRVASHPRSFRKGGYTTNPEHRPTSHREYLEWSPSRIINWAGTIGPHTRKMVEEIMKTRPHPEQGFRSCLGLIRLQKPYSAKRMEAACARALNIKAYSYKSVNSILKTGLDQQPFAREDATPVNPVVHQNIRGQEYYY